MNEFARKSSVLVHLEEQGYERKQLDKSKYGYVLSKSFEDTDVIFMPGAGIKRFFNWVPLYRNPDESFLVIRHGGQKILKILEKRNQATTGTIDTKLCLGPYFKEEYQELLGPDIVIDYAFCICDFLKVEYLSSSKKWETLRTINDRHGVKVFFGESPNYLQQLEEWIFSLPSGPCQFET
jgi:hypothetical protein